MRNQPGSGFLPAIRIPARQALLSRLIRQAGTDLIALDCPDATAVGLLLARTAQRAGQAVVTGDAADLRRIAPTLPLVVV